MGQEALLGLDREKQGVLTGIFGRLGIFISLLGGKSRLYFAGGKGSPSRDTKEISAALGK